jgi:peroxiredoxin
MRRLLVLIALCATSSSLLSLAALAQEKKDPAAAPVAPAAATPKRTGEQIQQDLQKENIEFQKAIGGPEGVLDPAKRKEGAPKVIPILKRMNALFDEAIIVEPAAKEEIAGAKLEFLTLLSAFGDAESATALGALAKGAGPQAVDAQAAQHVVSYLNAGKDEAAQLKVLDEVRKLAKANPKSDGVAQQVMKMSQMAPASKAVTDKAQDILVTDLTGEFATQVAERVKGERKMRESVGKPVELTGTTVDGKTFTTRDWKGKVILVDFWATWCGPCIKELPRVKKTYLTHHAKGLEILGVSCDSDVEALKGFLEKNKDMPWPQLFDAKENPKLEWHPVAKAWGINGIPTMFLIDKKGVLRSVEARADFEEEIPKMLEEKAE